TLLRPGPLPSLASSAGGLASFGDFSGTTGLSDVLESCVIGVRLLASRCGPWVHLPRTTPGSPGSHAWCVRACSGSLTARGPGASCDGDAPGVAFRFSLQRRHPGGYFFRG